MSWIDKKSKGKQRVPMVRIEKESNCLVSFSKRRLGLFKKVNELCISCGVEAAIISFSLGEKAFSFGHPSVDSTINRYIFSNTEANSLDDIQNSMHREEESKRLIFQLTNIKGDIESEKQKGADLLNTRRAKGKEYNLWFTPVKDLYLQDINKQYKVLHQLRERTGQFIYSVMNNPIGTSGSDVGSSSNVERSQFSIQNPFIGEANQMVVPSNSVGNMLIGPNNNSSSQMIMIQSPIKGRVVDSSMIPTTSNMDLINADIDASIDNLSSMTNCIPVVFHNPTFIPNLLEVEFLNPNPNLNTILDSQTNLNPSLDINPYPITNPNTLVLDSSILHPNQNMLAIGLANPKPITIDVGFTNQNLNLVDASFDNPNFEAVDLATSNSLSSFLGTNPMLGTEFHETSFPSLQTFNLLDNNNTLIYDNFQDLHVNNNSQIVPAFQDDNKGLQGSSSLYMLGTYQGLQSNGNLHMLHDYQGLEENTNPYISGNSQDFSSMLPTTSDMNVQFPTPYPPPTFNFQSGFDTGNIGLNLKFISTINFERHHIW